MKRTESILPAMAVFIGGLMFADQALATPLATLPDLHQVIFVETTFLPVAVSFAPDSPELAARRSDPLSDANRDYSAFPGEDYDFFYSDADGTPNPLGSFLTIEAVWPGPTGSMNINEVGLSFGGVSPHEILADTVSSFVYGIGPSIGSEALAVDGNIDTFARFGVTSGDQRMRLTVGFSGISEVTTPAPVPDSGSTAAFLLLSAGAAGLSATRRAREPRVFRNLSSTVVN